jgi:hypothetical protein
MRVIVGASRIATRFEIQESAKPLLPALRDQRQKIFQPEVLANDAAQDDDAAAEWKLRGNPARVMFAEVIPFAQRQLGIEHH